MSYNKTNWKKFKTATSRTAQKARAKVGKGEETVDTKYKELKAQMTGDWEGLKRVKKAVLHYSECVKNLSVAHKQLVQAMGDMYTPDLKHHNLMLMTAKLAEDVDRERVSFEESMTSDFIDPLYMHLGTYRTMQTRHNERFKRKTDMDRYRRDHRTLLEKAREPGRIEHVKAKLDDASQLYEELNAELLQDYTALHADRGTFMDPLLATMHEAQHSLFSAWAKHIGNLSSSFAAINRKAVHTYKAPVTSSNASSAGQAGAALPEASSGAQSKKEKKKPPPAAPTPLQAAVDPAGAATQAVAAGTAAATTAVAASTVAVKQKLPKPPPKKPAPPPGVVAVAVYDFAGESELELTFQAGDRIVISEQNGDWWKGSLNGRDGMLPSNYVELQ